MTNNIAIAADFTKKLQEDIAATIQRNAEVFAMTLTPTELVGSIVMAVKLIDKGLEQELQELGIHKSSIEIARKAADDIFRSAA